MHLYMIMKWVKMGVGICAICHCGKIDEMEYKVYLYVVLFVVYYDFVYFELSE